MSQVTFSVPDEILLALRAIPDAFAAKIRFAASVKLYEMGELSSGAAAQLAGAPKPYFLGHLADYGVKTFDLREQELIHDLKNAWGCLRYFADPVPAPDRFTSLIGWPLHVHRHLAAVVDGLERGRAIGVDLPEIRALAGVRIQAPEGMDKVPTAADPGAGEKEVLALGMQAPGAVLILDERLARLYANAMKLGFTGTLGILLRAKAEGRVSRVEPLLDHLDRLGFRLSTRTRATVLSQTSERPA